MLNKKQQNIDNNTLNFSRNNNDNNNNKNKSRIHFHYLFAYNVCFAMPPIASGKVAKKVEKLAKTNPKGDKKAPSPSARNHM